MVWYLAAGKGSGAFIKVLGQVHGPAAPRRVTTSALRLRQARPLRAPCVSVTAAVVQPGVQLVGG